MIEVELPDGTIAEFPAGTSRNVMRSALQKHLGGVSKPTQQEAKGNLRAVVDTTDAFGRGIANSASFGFADEVGAGARWLGGKVFPWQPNVSYDEALAEVRSSDKATAAAHPAADIAGNVTGAVGLGTGLVKAGLSPTTAVANRGGGLLAASGASALEGGILASAQGFGQGEGVDDRLDKAKSGLAIGGILGGAIPGVVSVGTNIVRRAVSPVSTSPGRQSLVDTLRREGVDVTAGQATGSNTLRYAESEIGGHAAQDIAERQGSQFTKAALSRAGINAERATPDIMDDAFNRIGGEFGRLGSQNNVIPDGRLAQDISKTWRGYMSMVAPSQRAPIIENTMKDLGDVFRNNRPLDGAVYQATRSRLDRAARGTADPELSNALYGLRNSLDDAMERSIAANNPADLGAFRQVRDQYKNMLVLEQAATGAGENAAVGIISPSALRNATVSKQGRRNFARGSGDFAELARAGEGIMKAMPQSGTAPRTAVRNLGAALPAMLGAGAGGAAGGGYGAVAGAAAGAAIPAVVGRLMMTGAGQAYLKNQLLSGSLNPQMRAEISAAINQIDATFLPNMVGGERSSQIPAAAAR